MMNDETTLLPCPFCGGEAHCEKSLRLHIGECWRVGCDTKGCIGWILESVLYLSEQMAVDKWNTRAERTCRNVGYYIDGTRFKCSECGYNGWTIWAKDGEDRVPNYCPKCGAKVVELS